MRSKLAQSWKPRRPMYTCPAVALQCHTYGGVQDMRTITQVISCKAQVEHPVECMGVSGVDDDDVQTLFTM